MQVVRLSVLRTCRLYSLDIFLVLISVRGGMDLRAIVQPEGLCEWKIPVTPSGIKPMIFQLVVQCLSPLCYCMPHLCMYGKHYCIYSNNARIMDHIKHLGDLFVVSLMKLRLWQSLCGFARGAEGNWVVWTATVDMGQVNNIKRFYQPILCTEVCYILLF